MLTGAWPRPTGSTTRRSSRRGSSRSRVQFVRVPGRAFVMGAADGLPCESPCHRVWVDTFLIARTPVTNREYAPYLDATGTLPPPFWAKPGFDGPDQPVVGLAWDEAVA